MAPVFLPLTTGTDNAKRKGNEHVSRGASAEACPGDTPGPASVRDPPWLAKVCPGVSGLKAAFTYVTLTWFWF